VKSRQIYEYVSYILTGLGYDAVRSPPVAKELVYGFAEGKGPYAILEPGETKVTWTSAINSDRLRTSRGIAIVLDVKLVFEGFLETANA